MVAGIIYEEDSSDDIRGLLFSKTIKSKKELERIFRETLESVNEEYQELCDEANPEHESYWIPEEGESYGHLDWDQEEELTDALKDEGIIYITNITTNL